MKTGLGMDVGLSRRLGFAAPMGGGAPVVRDFGLYLLGHASALATDILTIPAVTVAAGSTLLVVVHSESGMMGAYDSVTWGSTGLSVINGDPMANSQLDLWALYNATGGTFDLVPNNSNGASVFVTAAAFEVPGAAAAPLDRSRTNQSTSPSTSPTSLAMATTTNANDLLFAVLGIEGPTTDIACTWGQSFVACDRFGTSTGSPPEANSTLQVGSKIVAATGAYTSSLTAITARNWGMVLCGLKKAA